MDESQNQNNKQDYKHTHYTWECLYCKQRMTTAPSTTPEPTDGYAPCTASIFGNGQHNWLQVDD